METYEVDHSITIHADESVKQRPNDGTEISFPASDGAPDKNSQWTEQNTRRIALIKKRVRQNLTSYELEELERLQSEMSQRLNAAHPLPFDALNELEEYVDQAVFSCSSSQPISNVAPRREHTS
ncbi:MAG: hypothetical protein M3Y56_14395 [Armatimonadota bacterium]|nr:hypothetical protein [Armatimonadota bacterium]